MTAQIRVVAERPYLVEIGPGVVSQLAGLVAGAARVAVIHAPSLASVATELAENLPGGLPICVPDAEAGKTSEVLANCWERLATAGFTRSDAVVGLGGGATTDLAGFVAATYLRGVPYFSVPTTLLAMVDAAVGGKTGINLPQGKNLVGAFYEPVAVLADTEFLATLPRAELASGLAEAIKCGFIADPEILGLASSPEIFADPQVLAEVIERSVAVKAAVVSTDLREGTSVGTQVGRELLNYGHTLGHAIERQEGFTWRHGAAISVGMVFAAELAEELGLATAGFADQHREILGAVGLPVHYSAAAWPELRAAMALDKKSRGADLRFVLLAESAQPQIVVAPPEAALSAAFARLA